MNKNKSLHDNNNLPVATKASKKFKFFKSKSNSEEVNKHLSCKRGLKLYNSKGTVNTSEFNGQNASNNEFKANDSDDDEEFKVDPNASLLEIKSQNMVEKEKTFNLMDEKKYSEANIPEQNEEKVLETYNTQISDEGDFDDIFDRISSNRNRTQYQESDNGKTGSASPFDESEEIDTDEDLLKFRQMYKEPKSHDASEVRESINSAKTKAPKIDDDLKDFEGYCSQTSKEKIIHNSKQKEETKKHVCEICNYIAKYPTDLATHIRSVHDKIKDFKCESCEFSTSRKGHLNSHVKRTHEKIKDKKCESCEFTAPTNTEVKRHTERIHK